MKLLVRLTHEEHAYLKRVVCCLTLNKHVIVKSKALLLAADGCSGEEIVSCLKVSEDFLEKLMDDCARNGVCSAIFCK